MNRAAANWMGDNDVRAICLKKGQYQCWESPNDRARIISIGLQNPTYAQYVAALQLAQNALAGNLPDITNSAVSYGDDGKSPQVHPGSRPCLVDGSRVFYDLSAVA
jgi:hypothetical protein